MGLGSRDIDGPGLRVGHVAAHGGGDLGLHQALRPEVNLLQVDLAISVRGKGLLIRLLAHSRLGREQVANERTGPAADPTPPSGCDGCLVGKPGSWEPDAPNVSTPAPVARVTAARVIPIHLSLVMIIPLNIPLASIVADSETTPLVKDAPVAKRLATRAVSSANAVGTVACAASEKSTVPRAPAEIRPRRANRSRSRCRPRARRLLSVPTGHPTWRAAAS